MSKQIAPMMVEDNGLGKPVTSLALLLAVLVPFFTWLAHLSFGEQPYLYAVGFYAGLICSMLAMFMGLCMSLFSISRWKGLAVMALSSTWWIWLFWIMRQYDLFP